jgi:hypothetical protein
MSILPIIKIILILVLSPILAIAFVTVYILFTITEHTTSLLLNVFKKREERY